MNLKHVEWCAAQFIERLYILPMPVKYQPDLIYLRHVKTRRVHLFTLVQTLCFAAIMVVKEITVTSLAFPLTVSLNRYPRYTKWEGRCNPLTPTVAIRVQL